MAAVGRGQNRSRRHRGVRTPFACLPDQCWRNCGQFFGEGEDLRICTRQCCLTAKHKGLCRCWDCSRNKRHAEEACDWYAGDEGIEGDMGAAAVEEVAGSLGRIHQWLLKGALAWALVHPVLLIVVCLCVLCSESRRPVAEAKNQLEEQAN